MSEAVNIKSESYVGIVNDRDSKSIVVMVSSEGGVEIEEVAKNTPEKIFKLVVDPEIGLLDFQARESGVSIVRRDQISFQSRRNH